MLNFIIILVFMLLGRSQTFEYSEYFEETGARLYYSISGSSGRENIKEDSLLTESCWGGSRVNLIDTFGYGNFILKIIDSRSQKIIYSRPYNSLYNEWQLSDTSGTDSIVFKECISFPKPQKPFTLLIEKRDFNNKFYLVYSRNFLSADIEVKNENYIRPEVFEILNAGNPARRLDIVFFSEGYTIVQKAKFYKDAERFKNYLFNWQPFTRYANDINIHAVFVPSINEGVDIPQKNINVNTICNARFNTFGVERYLSVPDITAVYKYLNGIPCDQLCVLANSSEYGGGGIYNFYTLFTTDNEFSEFLFLHEFAHGFAALGDEYFNSDVSYVDAGTPLFEPYEPNITALIDFEKKWKNLVVDSIPVPTPLTNAYKNTIGVFEGANYKEKGYYRSEQTCAMFSSKETDFCKVCERSLEQMLLYYTK